ncbi:unnamed protein product [Moneuplotes crassus]|uniref:Uncharacterized protein n=1 Tax=Euplotes crassus TaxID=5936 RepID=A0AAD1XGL9_EUPCR|nr:unnamed protein product [Moneuplotes crassus]
MKISFGLTYLLLVNFLSMQVRSQCPKVNCLTSDSSVPEDGNTKRNRICSQKSSNDISISSNVCAEDESCFISQNWHGTCEPSVSPDFGIILYPGYRCRGSEVFGTCRFGTKVCNNEDRCEGYPSYHYCRRTSDCNFDHYCSHDGICLLLNENGESCSTHDSCEKNSMCHYTDPTDDFGTCVEVASKDERELVLPEYNKVPVRQDDMEKLCRTGMVNRTTGNCAIKLKSTNKGKECTTDNDCPTSDENVKAACKCGYSGDGKKYCDIEAGDTEWVDATNKFEEFFLTNLDCHTGEGFGRCGQKESQFMEYRCAEFKAKHYVELLNNPDCLKENYQNSPIFWEYSVYCSSWKGSILMSTLMIFAFVLWQ